MSNNIVVAIDGYSSCGKSTLAKALANKLRFVYIDTGAMYRAVTLYFLRNNIDTTDTGKVTHALNDIHISFKPSPDGVRVLLNNEDVSDEIRQMEVASNVSTVAAIREVRQAMVKLQQLMGKSIDVIMDGRDIGTQVFPHAQVKLFMTADPQIRAERRYKELLPKNPAITMAEVYDNIAKRDHDDTTRDESPLVQAPDAIVLDNSYLTPDEQLAFTLGKIKPLLEGPK
ncbi:(d)CMP kinase [Mucilaginibacter hurinus]|uniref:Cytidylate kinase n=1 Tax=Mucilaginibacter hurinus TaxID=2201324 RepID=A0A367GSW2_9SPHI|nr:(d)CMP kinase [Mucilaginibacter hurinus]RCH56507.1 (d)CMP kinase [Mucilaginibacter hurinus]